jgi:hypothetical protein
VTARRVRHKKRRLLEVGLISLALLLRTPTSEPRKTMNMSLSEKIVSGLTIAVLIMGLATRVFSKAPDMSSFTSSSVTHVSTSETQLGSAAPRSSWR